MRGDAPEQAQGDLPEAAADQLTQAVEAAMAATGSSGAIVGVWVPWSGTWVAAIGTDATGAPLDPAMGFRAGPITRLMTCDVLYSVAAEGTVALDDPVSDYVVGVPDLDDVTLEQLCDGSGGLGSSKDRLESNWITNPDRRWTPLELAAFGIQRERTAPGAVYRDSNSGYILLGMALEHATGESMQRLMKERVFDPRGMQETSLPGASSALPSASGGSLPGYVLGRTEEGAFDCAAPIDVSKRSASTGYADSGVVSTVTDLGRYFRALGAEAASGDESVQERWAGGLPVYADAPAWYTATGGGFTAGSLIGQFGSVPGYLTSGFVDPETGTTVVVVLNNSEANGGVPANLAWQLASIASKVPAAEGYTAPSFGLPWTAEQWNEAIASSGIACG